MKVGDLIAYHGEPHLIIRIEQSVPVAKKGLEKVVLMNTKSLTTFIMPLKWLRR